MGQKVWCSWSLENKTTFWVKPNQNKIYFQQIQVNQKSLVIRYDSFFYRIRIRIRIMFSKQNESESESNQDFMKNRIRIESESWFQKKPNPNPNRILARQKSNPNHESESENWLKIESMIRSPNHMIRRSLGITLSSKSKNENFSSWKRFVAGTQSPRTILYRTIFYYHANVA